MKGIDENIVNIFFLYKAAISFVFADMFRCL